MQKIFFETEYEECNTVQLGGWTKKHFNIDLPEEFIYFLKHNKLGSSPIPAMFGGKIAGEDIVIEEFLMASSAGHPFTIQSQTEDALDNERIDKNFLLFASGGGDHLKFAMIVTGPHRGKICAYLDGSLFIKNDEIILVDDALHLADSFGEFVDKLYADEVSLENWEGMTGYLPDEIIEKFGK